MIRTEYVHNSHYENPPQSNETPHFENLSLDIYRILWYIKIVIDSMHTFLLGGVGRPAYVRRDPPVHVVRFVRYVTLIGDYYALLRSRFALRLYGFLLDGFATTQHIGKRRMDFYAVSSLFVSADYGKTPTIQSSKALLQ